MMGSERMTEKEREIALYCLKANSDYHSEVCEECTNYPNCDHTIQDDVAETIIKAIEQQRSCEDAISRQDALDCLIATGLKKFDFILDARDKIKNLPSVTPQYTDAEIQKIQELEQAEIQKAYELGKASQSKIGHWIRWYERKEYDWGIDNIPHCKCSECGKEYDPHSSQFIKYCCECGVKMAESEEQA